MTATSAVDSAAGPSSKQEERKVLAGTLVGTTIEWYDFFIFAQLTATLFAAVPRTAERIQPGPGADPLLRPHRHQLPVPPARRDHCRPPGRPSRPQGHAGLHADHDGRRHRPHRRAAHLCTDRRLGPDPAHHPAHHPGLLRRRRMGRRRTDGRRARSADQARPVRRLPADRCAGGHDPGHRPAVHAQHVDVQGGLRRLGLAGSVPAVHRADRGGLPDPPRRGRKPGLQGDGRPQGGEQGAAERAAPQAQEGRALLHDDLHRQQRRRLPADRLLHLLRHQEPEDAHAADPAGHHRWRPSAGWSSRWSAAGSRTRSAA